MGKIGVNLNSIVKTYPYWGPSCRRVFKCVEGPFPLAPVCIWSQPEAKVNGGGVISNAGPKRVETKMPFPSRVNVITA